jgi:transcriptional regulator with PAS, ATPase and Fis domain
VRGSFTDAVTTKKGKFALADGGTIFLDEIGTMSPSVQTKMTRVIQDREFEPLGAEQSQTVDARVIAATNRNLRQMMAEGRFQSDLYYRLNVIAIDLQPLRQRREDIPPLVDYFVEKHARRMGRRIDQVEEPARAMLQEYDWPGNIRELENTIERAVVLSEGPVITAASLAIVCGGRPRALELPSMKLRENVEWAERRTVARALEDANGFKKDAAALMGVSQRALSYYLRKYRLD